MTGQYTKKEKIILLLTPIFILSSIIIRIILGISDIGGTVLLGVVNFLAYIIFMVAGLFPADWRMTDSQKAKIKDKEKYQDRYRLIIVIFTFILCFLIDLAIIFT